MGGAPRLAVPQVVDAHAEVAGDRPQECLGGSALAALDPRDVRVVGAQPLDLALGLPSLEPQAPDALPDRLRPVSRHPLRSLAGVMPIVKSPAGGCRVPEAGFADVLPSSQNDNTTVLSSAAREEVTKLRYRITLLVGMVGLAVMLASVLGGEFWGT